MNSRTYILIVNSLNTDKESRKWMHSTASFMDCTKTGSDIGIEAFLDKVVTPKIPTNPESNFKTIYGSSGGPAFLALLNIHSTGNYYGGIVLCYGQASLVQFYYGDNKYGIRFL